jgi:hypothetical protein
LSTSSNEREKVPSHPWKSLQSAYVGQLCNAQQPTTLRTSRARRPASA